MHEKHTENQLAPYDNMSELLILYLLSCGCCLLSVELQLKFILENWKDHCDDHTVTVYLQQIAKV